MASLDNVFKDPKSNISSFLSDPDLVHYSEASKQDSEATKLDRKKQKKTYRVRKMLNRRQDDDQFWRKNIEPYYWGENYFDHQYFGRIRTIVRFPPTIDVEPLPGYGAHGRFLQFRGRSRI